jgi:3-dehydroquinate dehydratase-2
VRIGVVNGPKLNRLGDREPEYYGHHTLAEIEQMLRDRAALRSIQLEFMQSDDESAIISWLENRAHRADGWLVNAAILTHSSTTLRDALVSTGLPFVELHLSNVFAREPFRRQSVLAERAVGVIAGFRENSYLLALDALADHLDSLRASP